MSDFVRQDLWGSTMPSLLLGMPSVSTVYRSCSNPPVSSPPGGPFCKSSSRLAMLVFKIPFGMFAVTRVVLFI